MPNRIVLKKGTTAGAAPTASDLVAGELAINTADGGLFTKLDNGTVYTLVPRLNAAITNNTIGANLVTPGTFPNGSYSLQNLTVTGTLSATASSAVQLSTSRTFALTGDVTGSVSTNLSSGMSIATTLATVAVTKGGTGLSTAPTTLQILLGQASGLYALRTLVAGTNITLQESGNQLTITAAGGSNVVSQATAPSSPASGDMWWDTDDKVLSIYHGGAWNESTAGVLFSGSLTTSTTTANQVVNTQATATIRSVKYVVQVTSGTAYQVSELLMIHNGTDAFVTEYALIATGAVLATFAADVSAGNMRLLVTPVNAATTIRFRGIPIVV